MSRGEVRIPTLATAVRGRRSAQRRSPTGFAFVLLAVLFAAGCRPPQQMADQPKYDPLEPSDFFSDGMASRQPVPGTVPHGSPKQNSVLYSGKSNGELVTTFPLTVDERVMKRGAERYEIYCSMCHGMSGYGDGMIVQRGFRKPPSLHDPRLLSAPAGHLFDVMTNGFGSMPPYGAMIPPEDRWAIAAYTRALQLSQNATLADIPEPERSRLMSEGSR